MFGPLVVLFAPELGDITLAADRALTLAISLQGNPQAPFTLYVPHPPLVAGPGQCSFYMVLNATRQLAWIRTADGMPAPCYAGHGNLILIAPDGNALLFN